MIVYHRALMILSSSIPVFKKLGYKDDEIKGGLAEAETFFQNSTLKAQYKEEILKAIKDIEKAF